jgi:uncharacterized protein YciI
MFIILLKYKKPLSEVDRFVAVHREFLKRFYASGHFLLSGRNEHRTGGVIIANAVTRKEIEEIILEDPFNREGIAEYEIIEFSPSMAAENLENFLDS